MSAGAGALKTHEPLERRTYQPVRRGSLPRDRCVPTKISRDTARRNLVVVARFAELTAKKGKRAGSRGVVSPFAVNLYRLICNTAAKLQGRVEYSLEQIVRMTTGGLTAPGRMKTVHAALCELRRWGLIRWDRRYVETGLTGRRGPQVQQTSNLYHVLEIPKRVLAALLSRKAPPPDDAGRDREAAEATYAGQELDLRRREQQARAVRAVRPAPATGARAVFRSYDTPQEMAAALRALADRQERESLEGYESGPLRGSEHE